MIPVSSKCHMSGHVHGHMLSLKFLVDRHLIYCGLFLAELVFQSDTFKIILSNNNSSRTNNCLQYLKWLKVSSGSILLPGDTRKLCSWVLVCYYNFNRNCLSLQSSWDWYIAISVLSTAAINIPPLELHLSCHWEKKFLQGAQRQKTILHNQIAQNNPAIWAEKGAEEPEKVGGKPNLAKFCSRFTHSWFLGEEEKNGRNLSFQGIFNMLEKDNSIDTQQFWVL